LNKLWAKYPLGIYSVVWDMLRGKGEFSPEKQVNPSSEK